MRFVYEFCKSVLKTFPKAFIGFLHQSSMEPTGFANGVIGICRDSMDFRFVSCPKPEPKSATKVSKIWVLGFSK